MSAAEQQQTIFLVTGTVQGGKTTFLSELVGLLKKSELKVGGFLSPGRIDFGERSGFNLKNIGNGMVLSMASAQEKGEWIKYRRFWFNPDAFKQGLEWIHKCLLQKPDVVVIDEVGPMELEGSGWSDALKTLRNSSVPVQL
ncbi:MAG: nucleoside-triphosphatase [Bacteroidales bacterium]|nr:nucleoside-triphosphatase [Bacteroidales bacterium]